MDTTGVARGKHKTQLLWRVVRRWHHGEASEQKDWGYVYHLFTQIWGTPSCSVPYRTLSCTAPPSEPVSSIYIWAPSSNTDTNMYAGTCSVKFIVESPPTITHDDSSGRQIWSIEAKCLGIEEPQFDSTETANKDPGIENARSFALARLDKAPVVIKLGQITIDNFKRKFRDEADVYQQVRTSRSYSS